MYVQIDGQENAIEIAVSILDNLVSTDDVLSGGGLIQTIHLVDQVIELRADQLLSSGNGGTSKDFADPSFQVINFLFSSTNSWPEITLNETRYRASSQLLAQVDIVGQVTLQSLDMEDSHSCQSSQTFGSWTKANSLSVSVERLDYDNVEWKADFVFATDSIKVCTVGE